MIYKITSCLGLLNRIEFLSKDDFANRLCENVKSKELPILYHENKIIELVYRVVELMENDNSIHFTFGNETFKIATH